MRRAKSGFRGPKLVSDIVVQTGDERLELHRDGGQVKTSRCRVSGGIVIKNEALDIDAWLQALAQWPLPRRPSAASARVMRSNNSCSKTRSEPPWDSCDRRSDPSQRSRIAPAAGPAEQAEAPEPSSPGSTGPDRWRGCPPSGRERLDRMKQDIARGFFTSDLSVNEFLLVKEAGFEPLGLVLGSSIYHIGFQQANWNQNRRCRF